MQKYKIANFILFGLLNMSFTGKHSSSGSFSKTPRSPPASPRQISTKFVFTSTKNSFSELRKAIEDNNNPLTSYAAMLLYSRLEKGVDQKLQIKCEGLEEMVSYSIWKNVQFNSSDTSVDFNLMREKSIVVAASLKCTPTIVEVSASTPQMSEARYVSLETIDPLRPIIGACVLITARELSSGATFVRLSAGIEEHDAFVRLSYSEALLKIEISTFYNTVNVTYDGSLIIEVKTPIGLWIFVKKAVDILDIIILTDEKQKILQTIKSITSEEWLNIQLLMIGTSVKDYKLSKGIEITPNLGFRFQSQDLKAKVSYILNYCNRCPGIKKTLEEETLERKVIIHESIRPALRTELIDESTNPKSPAGTEAVSEFGDKASTAGFSLFAKEISLTPRPIKTVRSRSVSADTRYKASAAIRQTGSSVHRANSSPPQSIVQPMPPLDFRTIAKTLSEPRKRGSEGQVPRFGTGDIEDGMHSEIGSLVSSDGAESFSTKHSNLHEDIHSDQVLGTMSEDGAEPEELDALEDWIETSEPPRFKGLPTVTNLLFSPVPVPLQGPAEIQTTSAPEFPINSPQNHEHVEDREPESEAESEAAIEDAAIEIRPMPGQRESIQQQAAFQVPLSRPHPPQAASQMPQVQPSDVPVKNEFLKYMIILFSILLFLCILYILALEAQMAKNQAESELKQGLTDMAADLLELSTLVSNT